MRKSIKICLITGAVLITLGIGISVSAVAMGATLDPRYGRGILNYVDNYDMPVILTHSEENVFYDIKNLDFDVDEGTIEMIESDDTTVGNQIIVNYDAPDSKVSIHQSGNSLEIESKVRRKYFGFGRRRSRIQVIVPKDYQFNEVDIESGASNFDADFLYADKLTLDAGVGEIKVWDGRVGELDMSGGVGSLVFKGTADGDISMSGGVGNMDVTLTGSEDDFNYRIECGVGNVVIGGSQYSGLANDRKIDNGAAKNMEVECGVGSISVKFEEEDV